MRFLIIIPCHNEEYNVTLCLESLRLQSHKNYKIVAVNDGSTDGTQNSIEDFAKRDDRFEYLKLQTSDHEPGAKVVRTFKVGLANENLDEFDIVCKFDADIIFPKNYLTKISDLFKSHPKVGMASGVVKIKKSVFDKTKAFDFSNSDHQWVFENISSKDHIRGPIKSYRKQCFQDIGGLREVLGWDNLDVMLAQMHGWEIKTDDKLWVKHLRPTAFKYKSQRAEKLGEYFYNLGLSYPLVFISSFKSAWKNHALLDFFITMKSHRNQKHSRKISAEEISFIRKLRWQQIMKKIF